MIASILSLLAVASQSSSPISVPLAEFEVPLLAFACSNKAADDGIWGFWIQNDSQFKKIRVFKVHHGDGFDFVLNDALKSVDFANSGQVRSWFVVAEGQNKGSPVRVQSNIVAPNDGPPTAELSVTLNGKMYQESCILMPPPPRGFSEAPQ